MFWCQLEKEEKSTRQLFYICFWGGFFFSSYSNLSEISKKSPLLLTVIAECDLPQGSMLHYLQRIRAIAINFNWICHVFCGNKFWYHKCQTMQDQTDRKISLQVAVLSYCSMWSDRENKIKKSWLETVLFIDVLFQMFYSSEKPTVLANLHHVYTDFFPLKWQTSSH